MQEVRTWNLTGAKKLGRGPRSLDCIRSQLYQARCSDKTRRGERERKETEEREVTCKIERERGARKKTRESWDTPSGKKSSVRPKIPYRRSRTFLDRRVTIELAANRRGEEGVSVCEGKNHLTTEEGDR